MDNTTATRVKVEDISEADNLSARAAPANEKREVDSEDVERERVNKQVVVQADTNQANHVREGIRRTRNEILVPVQVHVSGQRSQNIPHVMEGAGVEHTLAPENAVKTESAVSTYKVKQEAQASTSASSITESVDQTDVKTPAETQTVATIPIHDEAGPAPKDEEAKAITIERPAEAEKLTVTGHKRAASEFISEVTRKPKVSKTESSSSAVVKEEKDNTPDEPLEDNNKKTVKSEDAPKKEKVEKLEVQVMDSKRNHEAPKQRLRRRTCKVPSTAEQKRCFEELWTRRNRRFQICSTWLEKWKKYVGFGSKKAVDEAHPGPLRTQGSEKMAWINEEIWDRFSYWFGVAV